MRPKTRRRVRYEAYRMAHFTHKEALELSRLQRLDYAETRAMAKQRRRLWADFDAVAQGEGWSQTRRKREWRVTVLDFYVSREWVGKEERKLGAWTFKNLNKKDVWFWFNDVRSRIPEEKQYGRNPQHHKGMTRDERRRKAAQEAERVDEERVRAMVLDGLLREAAKNPSNDVELTRLAQVRGGFKGKSLLATARRRGYGS